jgi:hypothetical protein
LRILLEPAPVKNFNGHGQVSLGLFENPLLLLGAPAGGAGLYRFGSWASERQSRLVGSHTTSPQWCGGRRAARVPLGKVTGQVLTCSRATERGKPWRKKSWILATRAKRSSASAWEGGVLDSLFRAD